MSTEPGVVIGVRLGPFAGCLDGDLLARYAAATNDPSPTARAGHAAPAAALVTQIWDAQTDGRAALVPAPLQVAAHGGVHGEHDIVLHRPITPGEPLKTWVEGHGSRPAGRNSLVVLRYTTFDAADRLVAEQWWSTVYLGVTCGEVGDRPPDHAFPPEARAHRLGTCTVEVDPDMARRYAQVSGDWSEHHFDVDAARRTGFDRPFLHGLGTMALCTQAVVATVADGDPTRVARVAVRFATPAFVGEQLRVHIYDAGLAGYAFEADSAGATVVANGRLVLR